MVVAGGNEISKIVVVVDVDIIVESIVEDKKISNDPSLYKNRIHLDESGHTNFEHYLMIMEEQ